MADGPLLIVLNRGLSKESGKIISLPCRPIFAGYTLTLVLSLGLPLGSTKNGLPVPRWCRCGSRSDGCLKCFRSATKWGNSVQSVVWPRRGHPVLRGNQRTEIEITSGYRL